MLDWRSGARAGDALVTVLAAEGSAPRGAGARMAVGAAGVAGTIGGGALEYRAVEQARAILAHAPGVWRVQDYPLGPLLGQCCGGRVRLLVERLADTAWVGSLADRAMVATLGEARVDRAPGDAALMLARGPLPAAGDRFLEPRDTPRRAVTMFGAGHVGSAVANAATGLPLDLAWYDSRPDFDRAGLVIAAEDELVACAGDARPGAAVLILTHDHALDYRLTAAALASPASFVGLIGSATKRARFVSRLAADGIGSSRLDCPVGRADIIGKEPPVIAISILAQLLALGLPEC